MSHSFHLRIPPGLKDQLDLAGEGNGNSLNREIIERLARTFDPDPALQLADALRPFLQSMDEKDANEAVALIVTLLSVVSRRRPRKKR